MGIVRAINNFFGMLASGLVRIYQKFVSPLTPPTCRFYPTCSEYSRIAFLRHGFFRGLWLSVTRILRCNPFNPGGFDPVPPKRGDDPDSKDVYAKKTKSTDDIDTE